MLGVIPFLKKMNFTPPSDYHLQIASCLRAGFCDHFLSLKFVWPGFVRVLCVTSLCESCPVASRKHYFLKPVHPPWLL